MNTVYLVRRKTDEFYFRGVKGRFSKRDPWVEDITKARTYATPGHAKNALHGAVKVHEEPDYEIVEATIAVIRVL